MGDEDGLTVDIVRCSPGVAVWWLELEFKLKVEEDEVTGCRNSDVRLSYFLTSDWLRVPDFKAALNLVRHLSPTMRMVWKSFTLQYLTNAVSYHS